MHLAITEMFDTYSDPKTSPDNPAVQEAWSRLPSAIEAANQVSEYLMVTYGASDQVATRCLFHPEHILHALRQIECPLDEDELLP